VLEICNSGPESVAVRWHSRNAISAHNISMECPLLQVSRSAGTKRQVTTKTAVLSLTYQLPLTVLLKALGARRGSWWSMPRRVRFTPGKEPITEDHAVAQLVEALRYKPEGRGCDSQWSHWNLSVT
jgi:hypothetical protein